LKILRWRAGQKENSGKRLVIAWRPEGLEIGEFFAAKR